MSEKVGIAAFSFGLRSAKLEPNPSNKAIASEVSIIRYEALGFGRKPVIGGQWEVTKSLEFDFGIEADVVVQQHEDGSYLDSKDVWNQIKAEFIAQDVHDVFVVGQTFLHLHSLKQMVASDGFEVIRRKIGPIPFDDSPLNTQPWTRTRPALFVYAIKSLIPGIKNGHNGRQDAT